MSKTSTQFENSSFNYSSSNNQGKIQEGFQQMESQIQNNGGNTYTQQHTCIEGGIQKNFINSSKNDHRTIQFEHSQAQNSQSTQLNGNIQVSSIKQNETEENGYCARGIQGQSSLNAQISSNGQSTSYQTQTVVTKTIITSSQRISKSDDQGQEQFEIAEYEMMNGQSGTEGEANGGASALYKYEGYNLKADHAKLGGGLILSKYNFSDASLKEKQFKSSAAKVQMACDVAMAAALKKQEEQVSAGGAIANWELQLKSQAELQAQYQLQAKVTIKQKSHLMYGYGFRNRDGKTQQCDEDDQEKQKDPLNQAVCDAECIEKVKNKQDDLANVPQEAEEFNKKKKPNAQEEQIQEPEDFSKGRNTYIIQQNDMYFKPRSEDFIRLIPKSPQQIVYPVNSVRSIMMPQLVTCEPVQVARQSIRTKCQSVRQPVIIQEEVAPTIIQRVQGASKSLRNQDSFFTVQSVQQQLVRVQPQIIQQQAVVQVQQQPIIQQQQVVQFQEMQPLQQIIIGQTTQNVETYSQQHIQIQQPHLIGQTVQLVGQQAQFTNPQTVQMITQQPNLVVAQTQQVTSVPQQRVLVQGIQQEVISQMAVQQQQQLVTHTQYIQQDTTSPIIQHQIIQQPQVIQPTQQQQQIMLVSTQPLIQQQSTQVQQSVYQIQPQQTIQQIQPIHQVTSPLRQQNLVLQTQIPQNYVTQPVEVLQRSSSPIPISQQQQFNYQYILQKV